MPDSLLVDHRHIEFHNDTLGLADDAPIGQRERAFIENYEREFSWPAGRREIEGIFEVMQEAPPELLELLKNGYYCYRWVAEPTPEIIQQRFLESRVIRYKGADMIMPIVELANHGHATQYQTHDGVGLSGQFSSEVLVRYQLCDPLQVFGKWGFASADEAFALSVHMKLEEARILIGRGDVSAAPENKPFMPEIVSADEQLKLSYLLLGHKQRPALARGIFTRMMRDRGRLRDEADAIFDTILHANRMHMFQLLAASEKAPPRLGTLLRAVARFQLEAMSHSIGRSET
ncbi:MAG TPA: hypothetical protein VLC74_08590 [Rhizomicrobium sp.]|nr:hypothetical protein [Rhizomicrobium sp.]